MENIFIPGFKHPYFKGFSDRFAAALEKEPVAIVDSSTDFPVLSEQLLTGSLSALPYPLELVPPSLPEGIVITALSRRDARGDCLLVNNAVVDSKKMLQLPEKAKGIVLDQRQAFQLLEYRPDLEVEVLGHKWWERLKFSFENVSFFMVPGWVADVMTQEKEETPIPISLHSSEFITAPGQGFTAYLTLETSISVRRLLKKLHDPAMVPFSNVERGILQVIGMEKPLGARCEGDKAGNFHVHVALQHPDGTICRENYSSATTAGLVEKVVQMIMP